MLGRSRLCAAVDGLAAFEGVLQVMAWRGDRVSELHQAGDFRAG